MKKIAEDDIYKYIALSYMTSLEEELNGEEAAGCDTTGLDRKTFDRIHNKVNKPKTIRLWAAAAVAAAAMLITIVALPVALRMLDASKINSGTSNESVAEENYELIPISFEIPENLRVADWKVDNGVSVYYLENEYEDDIVLQMKPLDNPSDEIDSDIGGLQLIEINGQDAYAGSFEGYNVLSFHDGELSYKLTCRYDVNTLVSLGKNIL